MDRENFSFFFYNLLCKRKRRQHILLWWHAQSSPPMDTQNVVESIKLFVECIMYSPIRVVLTKNTLCFFGNNLVVPDNWLTQKELQYLQSLRENKHELFKTVYNYETNDYKLSGFKHNDVEYSLQHRRELIRDFILIGTRVPSIQLYFRQAAIKAIQWSLAKRKDNDEFLMELHQSLQLNKDISKIICT